MAGRRVLVADDSHDSALALSHLLEAEGCTVRTAFDGREAVQLAEEFLPAAILLDIGMPVMNGLQAAEHIRRASWGKEMLLVALSGWGQERDREKTKQAGFDDHLLKPADMDDLLRILARAQGG